ncbi:hypothetical protein [Burkholderia anthina]|uniref:hypothetical protein n=1 Tax=Burkholderia anthina TaxID=179879 RepID=UPI003C7DF200
MTTATACNLLLNPQKVRPTTVERVTAIIRESGNRPDRTARRRPHVDARADAAEHHERALSGVRAGRRIRRTQRRLLRAGVQH